MKNTKPKDLSLNFTFWLTLLVVFPLMGLLFLDITSKVVFFIIMMIWVSVSSYLLFSYSLNKFVYEKIRLIYKTIHTFKLPKTHYQRPVTQKSDELIESVNEEVAEWAAIQTKEIDDLRKLEVYRKEFLGNVSHELKTPIFNIQGYILTLLDGGLDDPTINKEYLIRSEQSINRMIAVVEDLEQISKLESGELFMNMTRFDIVMLTREIFEFLEMKARQAKIVLAKGEVYDKPIYVYADKENIKRVMINLIDNSLKYGRTDGPGKTEVSFFDMDENILIEVTDNGYGIEEQHLSRIFERFYRTDKSRSRSQGGTGLGLSIVKHIIEAHQQNVHVRSSINIGSTFGFTLKKG
ncbi:MAG: ATP-binding protein [Bacteroidota bacterium]